MSKQVSEADIAITVAEAFGHKPPVWAVKARKDELAEAGEPRLSVSEAIDVLSAAAFGRALDRGSLEEANRVIAAAHSGTSGSADTGALQQKMTALMNEVASLSESRLGLSPDRARLNAQSEALDARERAGTVAEAVKSFERYRDVLVKRPMHSVREVRS